MTSRVLSSFKVLWPVRLTSIAVAVVSACLRLWDVMDMLTAATALMRWIAPDPHAARCSSDARTATSACRKSGSVTAKTTAKTGQTKRYGNTVQVRWSKSVLMSRSKSCGRLSSLHEHLAFCDNAYWSFSCRKRRWSKTLFLRLGSSGWNFLIICIQNCMSPPVMCREYQWQCGDSSQCIPLSWRCDGKEDCHNSLDEHKCEHVIRNIHHGSAPGSIRVIFLLQRFLLSYNIGCFQAYLDRICYG